MSNKIMESENGDALCNIQLPSGVQLVHCPDFDISRCIICQKDISKLNVTSQHYWRDSVKRAAMIRDDDVCKRLKLIENTDKEFVYHNNYACYKNYTRKDRLDALLERNEETEMMEDIEESRSIENAVPKRRRSSVTPRSGPSLHVDSKSIKCVLCGNERVYHNRNPIREKFRICEQNRAQSLLDAANFLKDAVYARIADLSNVQSIFAADLYYHKICFDKYVYKYDQQRTTSQSTNTQTELSAADIKRHLFTETLHRIDPYIQKGYGFTMTEIKQLMCSLNQSDAEICNRDIKQLLVTHYGDQIQFSLNPQKNKPEMFFSSNITAADIASRMKNLVVF